MDYNKIGELVKIERKKLYMSQNELATLANVSKSMLRQIERGEKVSLDSLKKVLNLIGYDLKVACLRTSKMIHL